jgi:hypothetical protein
LSYDLIFPIALNQPKEIAMNKFLIAALISLFAVNVSFAADASCEAKAAEKKLAGAAKTSFLTKCDRDTANENAMKVCDSKAAEKKLAGAAKTSFTKKCVTDTLASNAQASCDAKAAEKKLAGAAKNSFTKKCVADTTK